MSTNASTNANQKVFFYSEKIFKGAGIGSENIQYAVALTGIVNVIMTIICVPLIDRLGRKPLLVYPMILIVINFILMTVFLHYQVIFKIKNSLPLLL